MDTVVLIAPQMQNAVAQVFDNVRSSLGSWGSIFVVLLGVAFFVVAVVLFVNSLATHGRLKLAAETDDSVKVPKVNVVVPVLLCCVAIFNFVLGFGSWRNMTNTGDADTILGDTVSYDGASKSVDGWADSGTQGTSFSVNAENYADEGGYVEDYTSGETYSEVAEQGFIKTADESVSTVSSDVDTASWSNIKRMLDYGTESIPDGAVRIEEFLNYFDYNYAPAKSDDSFAVTKCIAPSPWRDGAYVLSLGYSTSEVSVPKDIKSNFVFLVDVSGSMDSSDKLMLFKSLMHKFVDKLNDYDKISIVTYASGSQVLLDGCSGADKDRINSAIDSLNASGATNGEGGIRDAYEVAEKNFIKDNGVNRIIMASDGDLNVGISDPDQLKELISEKAKSGVYLSVLGFGTGNYNDSNMEALADNGNGVYYYVGTEEEGVKILCEDAVKTLIPFANDVKVQVTFNESAISEYRLVGYANRVLNKEDFRDDTKDAGDVGPGAQFTVLYEIIPANDSLFANAGQHDDVMFKSGDIADIGIRYKAINSDEVKEDHFALTDSDKSSGGTDDWKFACAVTEFGMLLSKSEYAEKSSLESIESLYGSISHANDSWSEFMEVLSSAKNCKLV